MKIILSTLNAKYSHSSLALRNLRACCQEIAAQFVLKEYTINHHLADILADIYEEEPDVLALACYIWNIEQIFDLCSLVHKVLPNCQIILGGPEVTYDADRILQEHPEIDYIIQGEGEECFPKLCQEIVSGRKIGTETISGLAFRLEDQIFLSGGPTIVENLDHIPFSYEEDEMTLLKDRILYFESSRGCPFSCQYCLSGNDQSVRHLSLSKVFQAIDFFIAHKVRQVKFVDRTFNTSKDHYFPILKYIQEHPSKTNFHFEIAVDILPDEVIEYLQEMPNGQIQFEIGVQSTFEPALKAIQRNNDWYKLTEKVKKLLQRQNIHLHLDLIAGLPYETYEEFRKSFNDVYDLKPHMLQLGFLKLLKGSGIRQAAAQHRYVWTDQAPYEVLANQYISYGELHQLKQIEELVDRLYNSGRYRKTLEQFVAWRKDSFAFYEELAKLWHEQERHKAAQAVKADFEILHAYALKYADSKEKEEFVKNLLKFDALLHRQVRLDFLPWNERLVQGKRHDLYEAFKASFWQKDHMTQLFPDFQFKSWRDLKKKYHLEVFEQDVTKDWIPESSPIALLFQYGEEDNIAVYQLSGVSESQLSSDEENVVCSSIVPIRII